MSRLQLEALPEDGGLGGVGFRDDALLQAQPYDGLLTSEAVWSAVLEVAHSMELFGSGDAGAEEVQRSLREAAADGWSCGVCAKRFAFQDLALAQACEARHGAAPATQRGLLRPRRRVEFGSESGEDVLREAAPARHRAQHPWGAIPAHGAARAASEEVASPWSRTQTLEEQGGTLTPPASPLSPYSQQHALLRSPGATGRVQTSADARAGRRQGDCKAAVMPGCAVVRRDGQPCALQ